MKRPGIFLGIAFVACATVEQAPSTTGSDAGADAALATPDASTDVHSTIAEASALDAADATDADVNVDAAPRPPPKVRLEDVLVGKFSEIAPLVMVQAPGDSTHWFVASREGRLFTVGTAADAKIELAASLPSLAGVPCQFAGEGGFLGFALHPKFAENGRAYVLWTSADQYPDILIRTRIAMITSPDHGKTFTTYDELILFDEGTFTHRGGNIVFGPDGYLYMSFGDGGMDVSSPQRKSGFLGNLVRIDVDHADAGRKYAIPPDNPFNNLVWAHGFRNPYRFSFDRLTGDLWVGDVGALAWEEVDRVRKGENYGWPCKEGLVDFYAQFPQYCPRPTEPMTEPLLVHEHTPGVDRAIIGGFVYRGNAMPDLHGTYLYGDYVTGEIFALAPNSREPRVLGKYPNAAWTTFAEDNDGEVYVVGYLAKVLKVVLDPQP